MSELDAAREREYFVKLCGFAPDAKMACADLLDYFRTKGYPADILNAALANRYARLIDAATKPAP